MRTLEKRTQNLREQAEATSGQLKTEAAREIEKIEGQLAQLQDQVQEIEPEADAAWEQAKPAIESALDRVEKWCAEIDERLRADSTERPSKQPSTEKH